MTNAVVAKNLQTFLHKKGKQHSWVIERTGMDETSFNSLLEGNEDSLVHLEKVAHLFRKEASDFYDENMEMPKTIEETEQERAEHEEEKLSVSAHSVVESAERTAETLQNTISLLESFGGFLTLPEEIKEAVQSLELQVTELYTNVEQAHVNFTTPMVVKPRFAKPNHK